MGRVARRRHRRPGQDAGPVPAVEDHRAGPRAPGRLAGRGAARRTSTPSRPTSSRGSPATSTSSAASAPSSGGTRRSWWSTPTSTPTASAATSRPSPRARRCTRSASTTSSAGKEDGLRRRPRLHPGPRRARHLRPRLPRGSPRRARPRQLPPRGQPARRPGSGFGGLSSYPHPWLMPDFWEYPTVSMGLGPINSIYQARFNRYLHNRHIDDTSQSRVWCFVGDGECDEPETLGSISLAARERLDNLTWVVNCNLQRLDGPVRGNDKIIQELESVFRGAGWNVIKVIWGSRWDELLARRRRRRAPQEDEHHARRRLPALRRLRRRPHPRPLLRPRPPAAQDGRAPVRRRPAQPAPRRPRLREALRRLQGRHRAERAHRPSSWPRPSRAGRSAPTSRAATPPTRSRR